jgi:hypothetical protein
MSVQQLTWTIAVRKALQGRYCPCDATSQEKLMLVQARLPVAAQHHSHLCESSVGVGQEEHEDAQYHSCR